MIKKLLIISTLALSVVNGKTAALANAPQYLPAVGKIMVKIVPKAVLGVGAGVSIMKSTGTKTGVPLTADQREVKERTNMKDDEVRECYEKVTARIQRTYGHEWTSSYNMIKHACIHNPENPVSYIQLAHMKYTKIVSGYSTSNHWTKYANNWNVNRDNWHMGLSPIGKIITFFQKRWSNRTRELPKKVVKDIRQLFGWAM